MVTHGSKKKKKQERMVTMAQSAANWRHTHTHMDRTHSLTHFTSTQLQKTKPHGSKRRELMQHAHSRAFTHTHVHSLTLTCIHSHSCAFTHTDVHSFTLTCIHSHSRAFTHTDVHSFTHFTSNSYNHVCAKWTVVCIRQRTRSMSMSI